MKLLNNLYRGVCLGLILPLCVCFGFVSFGAQEGDLTGGEGTGVSHSSQEKETAPMVQEESAVSTAQTDSAPSAEQADSEIPAIQTESDVSMTRDGDVKSTARNGAAAGIAQPQATDGTVQAVPTASTVLINGEAVAFEAYNIGGYNYFKLRDLAMALSGSEKKFELIYNQDENTIQILTGVTYTPDGQELKIPSVSVEKSARPTPSTVMLTGSALELTAYNIDEYNYFKLRDVGVNLDFYVGYDSETGTVQIDTGKSYDKTADETPWTPGTDPGTPGTEPEIPDPEVPGIGTLQDTYAFEWINEYSNYFTNKVQGYRIMVPGDMQADMGDSGIRAVLENSGMRIESYRQKIGGSKGFGGETYRVYSNKFLSDGTAHTKIYEGNRKVGSHSAYVLEWKRNPFSKVAGDRYYYASVDITVDASHILTFLFKSAEPFDTASGSKTYLDILDTLTVEPITATAYTEQKSPVKKSRWNQATKDFYEEYFGADQDVTWGIYEPAAPINYTELKGHEKEIGYRFPILLYYTNLPDAARDIEYVLYKAKEDDRYLELTLQTVATESGKGNMVYDVLNGNYDDILTSFAAQIAADGRPVLFRLANEMNGDWCVYSAWHTSKDTEVYVEFYRYVYSIFEAQGANANTIWVWNPNEKSFPDFDWNAAVCYYPGDEYADIVGMTGYNTGTYYKDETWRSFKTIYEPLYKEYTALYQHPLMITEFSCSKFGGDKTAWVEEMFDVIAGYDRIKAAIWWDGCDWDSQGNVARSYFINDTTGLMAVFREHLGDGSGSDHNRGGEGVLK